MHERKLEQYLARLEELAGGNMTFPPDRPACLEAWREAGTLLFDEAAVGAWRSWN